MQASVSRLLVARLLWAVLPLAASGSAPRGGWDSPNCTAGVVSVSRGEHAELACSMANPFSHVRVSLRAHPGESWQLVFDEQAPGSFRRDGWQLWVQGSEARLVIEKAQDAQAGTYRWSLAGLQRSFGTTVLNVLEPQDQLFTPSWGPQMLPPKPTPSPEKIPVQLAYLAFSPVAVLFLLLWLQRRASRRRSKVAQAPSDAGGPCCCDP